MLIAALILLAVAGAVSWFGDPWPRRATPAAWLICAVAALLLVVAGGLGMAGHAGRFGIGGLGGLGPAALRVDPLSGLFLVIAFGVAVPVLISGASPTAQTGWVRPLRFPSASFARPRRARSSLMRRSSGR